MRILAIGLGGAGSRIAGGLFAADSKSSRVACIQALAVDVDGNTIASLVDLPDKSKIYFPPLELNPLDMQADSGKTATVDIDEVLARVQNIENGETDAIFICCGLGGTMADVAPHIVTALRASITEPIFGLFTLPCLSEGEKRSAKAADDIDMLSPLLDGIILFDNETWIKKIDTQKSALIKKSKGKRSGILGLGKAAPELTPPQAARVLLNEGIVRRISLLLRAGEFKADGGIELAEVVMDSGEVLNTMKGMGFITIGYAVEHLTRNPLEFLTKWRPSGFFADEHNKKASRIVELAKQAIYNEISTPCDITSATKALVLVAGPSHELSMKGFMTVRKWIDRSIAGLETRSGDYPVTNTKYVAIIIMLSGLENIPRLTELREIRAQYIAGLRGTNSGLPETQPTPAVSELPEAPPLRRDEMLVLPRTKILSGSTLNEPGGATSQSAATEKENGSIPVVIMANNKTGTQQTKIPHSAHKPAHVLSENVTFDDNGPAPMPNPAISPIPRRRLVMSAKQERAQKGLPVKGEFPQTKDTGDSPAQFPLSTAGNIPLPRVNADHALRKERERQRIEHELQRHRMVVMGGRVHKKGTGKGSLSEHAAGSTETARGFPDEPSVSAELQHGISDGVINATPEKRTVVFAKKKIISDEKPATPVIRENPPPQESKQDLVRDNYNTSMNDYSEEPVPEEQGEKIGLKMTMRQANDSVLSGKGVSTRAPTRVKDDALFQTKLKPKKTNTAVSESSQLPTLPELKPITSQTRVIRKRKINTEDIDEKS